MNRPERIKVLIANPGLDVHDAGARFVSQILRDAGMEVVYLGIRQTAPQIVAAAVQEDVDIIGLSLLSGKHNTIVPQVMDLLREKGAENIPLVLGGVIPFDDVPTLQKYGVKKVFRPGTSSQEIIESIEQIMAQMDSVT